MAYNYTFWHTSGTGSEDCVERIHIPALFSYIIKILRIFLCLKCLFHHNDFAVKFQTLSWFIISRITFEYENSIANAKSVLSILGAGIKSGDEILLICEGEEEEKALKAMIEAIESGLGE